MNSKKNAQIKFGETFGVIILVYIIVMVGMIWYNNINTKDIAQMNEKNQRDRAFEKYYYVINSDMLHVSEQGDVDPEFSLTSFRVFSNYTKNEGKEHIRQQLGESIIVLEIVDKDFVSQENLTVYNNTPKDFKNRESFKTLIPVMDKINKKTSIGILTVYTYS